MMKYFLWSLIIGIYSYMPQWVDLMLMIKCSLGPNSYPPQWRHNELDCALNHRRLDCLLKCLFKRWSKKTSKFRLAGLCEGNSLETGEFPAQRASNAEMSPFYDVIMHYATLVRNSWCYDMLVHVAFGQCRVSSYDFTNFVSREIWCNESWS